MPQPDFILLGLTGAAGAGKDTVAGRLEANHGFVTHAFAEPIRDMLTALLTSAGIDYAHLFERHLKELPVPWLGTSGRRMMQTLGTEWGRALHPDLWVRHAALTLGLHDLPRSAPVHDRIVITDERFANEANWIQSLGGKIIRVQRPVAVLAADTAAHASEHQFGDITPWVFVHNIMGFDYLHQQVDAIADGLTSQQTPHQRAQFAKRHDRVRFPGPTRD
jgi:hypothetical protein